jgi:kumamolisin
MWTPPKKARFLGAHLDTAPITVTVVLEKDASIQQVFEHADNHGLEVPATFPQRRVARLSGTPQQLAASFGVELHSYEHEDGHVFHAPSGEPVLPTGIKAVLGLDKRPVAHPYFHTYAHLEAHDASFVTHDNLFNPYDLGTLYDFPPNTTGHGQVIAIIELGGGFDQENLTNYFRGLGLPVPSVTAVSVLNTPYTTGSDADGEVQLDIEVAGCLAPDATFMVYFAPNTDEGFHEAISEAMNHPTHPATVISISWGGPEDAWSSQAIQAVSDVIEEASAKGIPVTVAAGDNGASDGESGAYHVDFPGSSPGSLTCGGTSLVASRESISQETVWNDGGDSAGATGGGVSQVFPKPSWQSKVNVPVSPDGHPGRGVPDVAGLGDPNTGYYVMVNGEGQIVGGTSAVAPLWAALIARIQQSLGKGLVNLNQEVYSLPASCFRDITQGNNDGYSAATGWDPCTGFGSPIGTALLNALK